jgi:fumarate reductase subunit D
MNQDHPETVLRRFDRKVFWQRFALGFEGLWQALFWPSMVVLATLALIGSGLLSMARFAMF